VHARIAVETGFNTAVVGALARQVLGPVEQGSTDGNTAVTTHAIATPWSWGPNSRETDGRPGTHPQAVSCFSDPSQACGNMEGRPPEKITESLRAALVVESNFWVVITDRQPQPGVP